MLGAVKSFVAKYDSPQQADAIEKMILSLSVKIAMLYKEKRISKEYFVAVQPALHLLCDKLIDAAEMPSLFNADAFYPVIKTVRTEFEKIFKPFLPEKSMEKMGFLVDYFSSEALLTEFFSKRKWQECQVVGNTLRKLWDLGRV